MDVTLHSDGGDGGFGAVNDQVDGDLEEGINKGETLLCGATFGAVFVEVVAGGDKSAVGYWGIIHCCWIVW